MSVVLFISLVGILVECKTVSYVLGGYALFQLQQLLNIILSFMLMFSKWYLLFRLPKQNCVCISYTCMPSTFPARLILLNSLLRLQIMKLYHTVLEGYT
jgi:hypothetical protein